MQMSSVLVLVLSSSILPSAYAEGEETPVQPNVLIFRDYEDYTKGADPFNSSKAYGTYGNKGTASFHKASTVKEGLDGKGVQFNTGSVGTTSNGVGGNTLTSPLTNGKVYIAFDIAAKTDAELDAQDGTSAEGFDAGYKGKVKTVNSEAVVSAWVESDVAGEVLTSETKEDVTGGKKTVEVYDVTEITEDEATGVKTTSRYTKTVTTTPVLVDHQNFLRLNTHGNQDLYLRFSTQHSANKDLGDNSGTTLCRTLIDTKTHKIEWLIDLTNDKAYAFVDGEQIASKAYTYDISQMQINLTNGIGYWDNFIMVHYHDNVENTFSMSEVGGYNWRKQALTVEFNSDATTVDDTTTYEAPYPIILSDCDDKNTLKVETAADYITVKNSAGEEVLVESVEPARVSGHYDIILKDGLDVEESYTVSVKSGLTDITGAAVDTKATATITDIESDIWHDYDFKDSAKPSGWINNGGDARVSVDMGKYGKGMALKSGKTAGETFNVGKVLNTGKINISFDYMDDEERTGEEHLSFNNGIDRKYVFYMRSDNKFRMAKDNLSGYGDSAKYAAFNDNTLYHLDLFFDFDNLQHKAYVNGEPIATSTLSTANNIENTYWVFNNTCFFDNFKMAKVSEDSFGIQKAYWVGDYAEILLTEGASADAHLMSADDFSVVDSETNSTVTPETVEVVGRRIIFSGLDKSKDYEITLPENYSNFLGTELSENTVSLFGETFKAELKLTADKYGTELTEEIKDSLNVGDKVYAELTYKNSTGLENNFVVFGASYADGQMTDANFKEINSSGTDADYITEYIEIDVTDTDNLSFKLFAWDSFETLNPRDDIKIEYPVLGEEYVRFLGRGEQIGDGRTFNWPNAGFEFEFTGETVEVFVSASKNDSAPYDGSYFTMAVYDGEELVRTERMKLCAGWNTVYTEEAGDPDEKTIMLVRSSEACKGTLAISKVKCDMLPEPTEKRAKQIEFIGDSLTAGYGNSPHLSESTSYCAQNTDNWNSYTGIVARHYGADATVIAHQGKGVYANHSGSTTNTMSEMFNYSEIVASGYNMSTKALHDFSSYQPQLVSVLLGANDMTAGVDLETFKEAFEALLDNIRSKYPNAKILCVTITGRKHSNTIKEIVDERGEDNNYYLLNLNKFQSTSLGHPDIEEDKRMAEQFIAKIDTIEGLWD